jgi:predicted Fe-Mo cluster-binding NifX family protein
MILAIPIWAGRVSPLMDTASQLLVVELDEDREVSRQTAVIPHANHSHRATFLTQLGVDVLICGAISRHLERALAASGIQTFPWFRGGIEEIITAYRNGALHNENHFLPGCWRRHRRGGGRCGRPGARPNRRRHFEEDT